MRVDIMFLESSALNASNVNTAFEMLVASIYKALQNNEFDDRLDQFNYFSSQKLKQKVLCEMMEKE